MLIILTSALTLGSLTTLALMVTRAPEGYETETGLHIIRRAEKTKSQRPASGLTVAQAQP